MGCGARVAGPLAGVAGAGLAWGLFESQWIERRVVQVPVADLPEALDGLRILHLSDFHLGSISLNTRVLRKAVRWAEGRSPDLVAVTGDLLSRTRGEKELRAAFRSLPSRHGVHVALGNHDVAITRDPFSSVREIGDLTGEGVAVLRDSAVTLEHDGVRVQLAGVDPRSYLAYRARPSSLADPDADFRILLCHFPKIVDRMSPGTYQLVLAGHIHGGQICLPYPGGKIRFGGFGPSYPEGTFRVGGTTLVVSRGTGTGFVPFRFFARPEVSELVLRPARQPV